MSINSGLAVHRMLYELSPIFLTNGIAAGFPVPALPLMAITETVNFPFSILSGSSGLDFDDFFAHYQALPNSILIGQQIGKYPFANSTIAANATMKVPKTVSMLMICPVQNKLGWLEKSAIMRGLVYALEQHNALGGTYLVLTPSFAYFDCLMLGMHDISAQITRQVQNAWQLDFEQPLVTQSAADRILNSISKMFENSEKPVTSGVYGPGINGPGGTAGLPTLVPSAVGPGASQVSGTGPTPTWTVPSGTRFPIS